MALEGGEWQPDISFRESRGSRGRSGNVFQLGLLQPCHEWGLAGKAMQ